MPIDAGKVKEMWAKGVAAQQRLLVNYDVNTAFVLGDQWVYAEPSTNQLRQVARDPDRVQATINRLLPATRTIQAKLHKRPLVWEVTPLAADDASVRQARLAESVVQSTASAQDWESKRVEADSVTWLGGTGVLWVSWDPSAGTHLSTEEDGREVGTGDVVVTVSSIAQTVVEPGSRDARRARWAIRAVAIPPEEAKDTYGLSEIPQADAAGVAKVHDVARRSSATPPDLTMVYSFYRRPSRKDKGEVAVVIGNKVIESAPWPYPFTDHLPLAVQRETAVAGQWAGDTVVTSAIQVQSAYNMSWSSLLEHVKLAGNARGLMPEGNLDLIDEMTDSPGEWLVYRTDAGAPAYLSPPQLPQWVIDSPAMLRRELDDILGTQDISRGAAPSNIESGLGISILAEQADTPVMQMAAEAARAWSDVASDALKLYEMHASETRTSTIHEEGRPLESQKWSGRDLEGVTEAHVPLDQVLPKSQAAQQALAIRLWELGAIKDPEVLAALGDLPERESFVRAINPDAAKAADENADMAVGIDVEVAAFDDHATHIRVLNTFRKSKRFRSMDAEGQARYDKHAEEHEDAARAEQAKVAAEAMVSPLAAPPPMANEAEQAAAAMAAMGMGEAPPEEPGMELPPEMPL